ncbi:phosphoglycerate dehydrogenase [Kordiimonas aestuarii]|uniref:phosphoglycerate dehydrogenase n=1 Tax=Kordiimonas aestuarii TaxID=1005925 RepID=UPI0021CE7F2B|nr:phosphoglycerate dehydrogenase [Kordiimonas aestuarii]
MSGHRVIITQRFFHQGAIDYLRQHGCEPHIAPLPTGQADGKLSHDHLCDLLAGAKGWVVGHARVTEALITALPDLEVISRRGVGYDRVDTAAAARHGRVVCIASGGNDASVADHAIAMMLALGRRFRESQRNMAGGDWSILQGHDLYGKTVGIVGLGRIGQSLVKRLSGFDARIFTPAGWCDAGYARAHNIECVEMDTLLAESDYISLHAPLTDETRFLIDEKALRRMKESACLINTARGGLVDDRALLAALKSGQIAGAGLDTFVSEGDPTYADVSKELIALDNVIASPHAAASSVEGLERTNMIAARCVVDVLEGRTPPAECVVADGRTNAPYRAQTT